MNDITTTIAILPEHVQALDAPLAAGLRLSVKKPMPVRAVQLAAALRVRSMEGDDLMCGVDGEPCICDRDIVERTHDWLQPA